MPGTAPVTGGTSVSKTKQNKKGFSSWSLQSKENRLSNSNKPIYWKINICSVTSTELKALYQSG